MVKARVIASLLLGFLLAGCPKETRTTPELLPPEKHSVSPAPRPRLKPKPTAKPTSKPTSQKARMSPTVPLPLGSAPKVSIEKIKHKWRLNSGPDAKTLHIDAQSAAKIARTLAQKLLAAPQAHYDATASKLKTNYFHHVYLMLPSYAPAIDRNVGYYTPPERDGKDEDFAFLVRYADRSPASVRLLYRFLEPHLEAFVPADIYVTEIRPTVIALRQAHLHLSRMKNSKAALQKLYRDLKALERKPAKGAYGRAVGLDELCAPFEAVMKKVDSPISGTWLLTFWARREGEGNRAVVLELLGKLDAKLNVKR